MESDKSLLGSDSGSTDRNRGYPVNNTERVKPLDGTLGSLSTSLDKLNPTAHSRVSDVFCEPQHENVVEAVRIRV